MRCLLVFAAATGMLLAATNNPKELVRQSIAKGERAWEDSHTYYYVIRDIEKRFDSSGHVSSVDDDVFNAIPIGGSTYEEFVSHDGHPLPPDQARKEQQKLQKVIHDRQSETPAQRARRLAQEKKERAFMFEVPDAFDWKLIGTDNLPSGPAWVLQATPRPGYQAQTRYARMFAKMEGKLWIDQRDMQWVKADAVAIQPVYFGFFFARLAQGAHIHLEQQRLPDGLWVPKQLNARADARILLFFDRNFEEDISYGGYRASPPAQAATSARR